MTDANKEPAEGSRSVSDKLAQLGVSNSEEEHSDGVERRVA